jgi:two-component system response regulator FixJ
MTAHLQDILIPLKLDFTIAQDGKAAFEKLKGESFDVIVTDGIELLSNVREMGLGTPVILVSENPDKEMIIQGLKLGAFDFIEKPYQNDEILKSVRSALHKCEGQFRAKLGNLDLSQVQLKILELVFQGEVNKDIAAQVNLSEKGFKYHISLLFQRFSAKNRGELKLQVRRLLNK